MKRTLIIIACCLLASCQFLSAQESKGLKNGKIGVSASYGVNEIFRFEELIGAASYNGSNFFTGGISYALNMNKWLEIETGLEYSKHNFYINPNVSPYIDVVPKHESFEIINVPVNVKANFLKFFYINAGAIVDIDVSQNSSIDRQTGLGTVMGVGIKYDFDFGGSVFINPYTKVHTLIPFTAEDYQQRVWEKGFRIGVTYDLRQMKPSSTKCRQKTMNVMRVPWVRDH